MIDLPLAIALGDPAGIGPEIILASYAQLRREDVPSFFVIGGANSAGQGAMFLSRFASRVTMLIRGDSLKQDMSQYLIDQIDSKDNISVRVNSEMTAAAGKEYLENITVLINQTGESETLAADAVFRRL